MNRAILACESLPITVALISNHDLVQLGVQRAFEAATRLRLVGHADSGLAAGVLLARTRPQVILIDTESDLDMTELVRVVRATVVGAKIVALCGLEANYRKSGPISAQVDAVVLTVQPTVVLIATIESLCQTLKAQNPFRVVGPADVAMSRAVAAGDTAVPPESKWPDTLTEREREVIAGVGQGLSNKAIAALLCISDITVRNHLANIFDKLGVSSRQKLLLHGHRCGFPALKCLD